VNVDLVSPDLYEVAVGEICLYSLERQEQGLVDWNFGEFQERKLNQREK